MRKSGRVHSVFSGMEGSMKNDAINVALRAVDIFGSSQLREVANYIRDEFDRMYNGHWNCIVNGNCFPVMSIETDFDNEIEFMIDNFVCVFLFRTPIIATKLNSGSKNPFVSLLSKR